AAPLTPAWQTLFPTLQQPWQESRASQTLSFHPERLACEPLGRGRCWLVGSAHRQHLPLPVSAFGASSQSVQRRLRSPESLTS
ncbi:MAG TPA: hypothetical protein VFB60_17335, partial [Ktedonobacteraceae bacterium]|nr:hypothetical protein [Ktedonobacteraceae bacterium]